jgi:GxxExxY protein
MIPNELTEAIIGAAIDAHRALGPGLLECVYEDSLVIELGLRNVSFTRQVAIPIRYKGILVKHDLRIDLLVADFVVVELKSVEKLLPVHEAQLLTYLRLTGRTLGLLINFNVPVLRLGIKRLVNNFKDPSAPPRLGGEG